MSQQVQALHHLQLVLVIYLLEVAQAHSHLNAKLALEIQ